MNLLELQMKADVSDALRKENENLRALLRQAQELMQKMDTRYRAEQGVVQRLLQRDKHNRENAEAVEWKWWFKFLPSSVKCLVWKVLD